MKTTRQPFFVFCCVMFICNQLLEQFGVFLLYLHSYLDDLVCLPIILTFALVTFRQLFGDNYTFSFFRILISVAYVSPVMEIIIPNFSHAAIADPLDVAAYLTGGILFHLFINIPLNKGAPKVA